MASEILMPKMGYDMTEGKVLRWLKREGDAVAQGEAVVEIETDKVAIEVEAFAAGILRRIEVAEGQTVPVGARIGIVAAADEVLPVPGAASGRPPASPAPATPAAQESARLAGAPPAPARAQTTGTTGAANASPLARRLALEHGVDLATVTGTGPGGRITREDVLAAAARVGSGAPAQPNISIGGPSPGSVPISSARAGETPALPMGLPPRTILAQEKDTSQGADERRPLSRLQQTMGRRMAESKAQAPHFYLTMRVDMTEALALRSRLNDEAGEGGARISVNDLVVKAVAGALRAFPVFNATFASEYLTLHWEIGICIAVAIEEGLVTPVLRGADRESLAEIARESTALVERTRAGKNRPEDFEGGTFTVSNLGMYDVDTFVAIINPPQAAILAVGAVTRTPVYQGETLVPRSLLNLTLSTDHRVADGATAARFLAAIRAALEQPDRLA